MKKFIFLLSIAVFSLSACRRNNPEKDVASIESELSFEVNNTVISDGNYSISPNVYPIDSDTFVLSLGAVESFVPRLDKVTLLNNSLNFYTSVKDADPYPGASIPQMSVSVNIPENVSFSDLKFNIIKSDYENLKLNFSASQALSKFKSEHGIASRVKPEISLESDGDSYLWKFNFESAFIKGDAQSPLMKVLAKVNSNSGDTVSFEKKVVSKVIAQGYIVDFNSPKSKLVYTRSEQLGGSKASNVYLKDLLDMSEQLVFSSMDQLAEISISDSSRYLAVVERPSYGESKLSVRDLDSDEVTSHELEFEIGHLAWYGEHLYMSCRQGHSGSRVMVYSPESDSLENLFDSANTISSLNVYDDSIVYSVKSPESELHLFEDGSSEKLVSGRLPIFIQEGSIVFLAPSSESGKSDVVEYNIDSGSSKKLLSGYSVKKMFSSGSHLYMVVSGVEPGLFDLISYSFSDESDSRLFTFTNENIFFNFNTERIYFSTVTGAEANRRIYSIDI